MLTIRDILEQTGWEINGVVEVRHFFGDPCVPIASIDDAQTFDWMSAPWIDCPVRSIYADYFPGEYIMCARLCIEVDDS